MVIRINGRFLTQPLTGVQQYARRLSKYLTQLDEEVKIITPVNSSNKLEAAIVQAGRINGVAWEQLFLPSYLKKYNHPLLINFCNTAPLIYQPQVVTIHDLAFKLYPHTFHPVFAAYYNWLIPRICRNATIILTVSQTVADEINHYYKIPASKIRVIYNTAEIVKTKHYRENYMLSVGTIQPRKNYRLMLDAFKLCRNDWHWIIVGSISSNFRYDKNLIYELKSHPRIKIIENISEEELSLWYHKASVLVSASIYEGCNLPVLEAIQHGCPVLISDIQVHRELYSGKAQFFRIDQPEAAAELAERINTCNPTNKQPPDPIQKFTLDVQGPELWRSLHKL